MTKKHNLVLSKDVDKGHSTEPKLKFLTEFMTLCGECSADIARATGLTRGGVSHWFSSDDCKLSYCEQYINLKGYELVFELKKQNSSQNSNVSIIIERKAPEPDESSCRRLLFLLAAMAKHGISKVQMAKDLDLKYNTVRHWFIVDDIYISHIFRIAEIYDLKINIDIKPKEEL